MRTVVIDFETRSKADIKNGPFEYASHPSTEILCLAWCYEDNNDEPEIWGLLPELQDVEDKRVRVNTADGSEKYRKVKISKWELKEHNREGLEELFRQVRAGEVRFEAHNHAFEWHIWNITGEKYGFPKTPAINDNTFWSCSAAKAAANGLPRSLSDVAKALHLDVEKDDEGAKVMMQLCKPRKPTANNPDEYYNDRERFDILFKYCKQDVVVERAVSRILPDLDAVGPCEKDTWSLDALINYRGVPVDRDSCKVIKDLLVYAKEKASERLQELTGGCVRRVTETTTLREWITAQGVECSSVSKAAITSLLDRDLPSHVREVLDLRQSAGKSSVAKFDRLLDATETDGVLRSNLLYYGAGTGRWSGKGVQLQNLPRGSVGDVMQLVDDFTGLDYDALESKYGNVFEAASSAIRPMLKAPEGYKFVFADFASIEARVLPWLAKDEDTLDMIRNNRDLYKEMATDIYGVAYDDVTKDQRQVGKAAILGLGYSMGVDKFDETMKLQRIEGADRELAELAVSKYREKFNLIKELWYSTERAAVRAFRNPGSTCTAGRIKFWRRTSKSALFMILPSGRRICFFEPELEDVTTPWGAVKPGLKYKKQLSSFGMKFLTARTYGGDLVQTATQATARDCMVDAMFRLEDNGYRIVLSVHDEVICLVPDNNNYTPEQMEILMTKNSKWSKGLPIGAEGVQSKRYHK